MVVEDALFAAAREVLASAGQGTSGLGDRLMLNGAELHSTSGKGPSKGVAIPPGIIYPRGYGKRGGSAQAA